MPIEFLSTIKQVFTYGVSRGSLPYNIASPIRARAIGGVEKLKERFLTMNEIKSLWQFLDTKNSSRMSLHTKIAIKLIILTGVRTAELRLARWGDFDIEKSVWTIPAENTKTRLIHKVHLGI